MKKFQISEKRRKDLGFIYLVYLWPVIHFSVFWVAMNISTIKNAFFSETLLGELKFVGWKNFIDVFKMFSGERVEGVVSVRALPNVGYLMLLCLFVNLPITLFFSYMIMRKIKGYRFFQVALFIPTMTSAVVLCLVYKLALNTQYGFVPQILKMLGLSDKIPAMGLLGDEKTTWPMILVFSVWTGISGNLIYFCSAMSRIPEEIVESSKLDGADDWTLFLKFVLPLIWPTVTTMMVSYLSANFAWYIPSLMLGGADGTPNGTTSTIGLIIVQMTKGANNNGFTSALSVVIGIIGGAFILLFKRIMEKVTPEVEY